MLVIPQLFLFKTNTVSFVECMDIRVGTRAKHEILDRSSAAGLHCIVLVLYNY